MLIVNPKLVVFDLKIPLTLGFFTLGDAWLFLGLRAKIPPLGSMLNFDADVKK